MRNRPENLFGSHDKLIGRVDFPDFFDPETNGKTMIVDPMNPTPKQMHALFHGKMPWPHRQGFKFSGLDRPKPSLPIAGLITALRNVSQSADGTGQALKKVGEAITEIGKAAKKSRRKRAEKATT